MENTKKISITVDGRQLVEQAIVAALEGGSNYWYWIKNDQNWFELAKRHDKLLAQKEDPKRESYSPLAILISNALLGVDDFDVPIYDLEDTDDLLGVLSWHTFVKGCQLCSENYCEIWARIVNQRDYFDASDADVLLQLAVMGEVKFS
jgi:hypothetical protein